MNKLIRFALLVFVLFLLQFSSYSQDCGIQEHHENCMASDPIYQEGYMKNEAYMKQRVKDPQIASRNSQNGPYVLPMVIHIIHIGEEHFSNVSEEIVHLAMEKLNNDFNGSLYNGNIDTEIEFCLASIDPEGNPTNGINRVDGSSLPGYIDYGIRYNGDFGTEGSLVKDLSRWPTSQYMNVWVAHRISGNAGAYATYPNGGLYDGVVMQPGNLNSGVFAHELGHNLNLFHTFDGNREECIENEDCQTQGDRVCDTPAHQVGDCSFSQCIDTDYFENSSNNFMSYCGNYLLFTPGQKERMHATIEGPIRRPLLSSLGCASSLPTNNVSLLEARDFNLPTCGELVSPVIKVMNQGSQLLTSFEARYRMNGGTYKSIIVNTSLAYGASDYFTLDGIEAQFGENSIDIEVLNPNGQQDEISTYDMLSIVYDNTVENVEVTPEYFEDFESYDDIDYSQLPYGYSSYGLGASTFSRWYHVRNGVNTWLSASSYSTTEGEEDIAALKIPLVDLTNYNNAKLLFKYSFTRHQDFAPDGHTLKVVAYRGCDGEAEVLWQKSDYDLQTVIDAPPNAIESYKAVSIDISSFENEKVKIEFQYSYRTQDSYSLNLDNILVRGDLNGAKSSCQIPISSDMIFNPDGSQASANSGGASLFDEQNTIGEPPFGLGGNMESPWLTPYAPDQKVYLDLGEVYNISSIYYYDTNGQGQFKIKPTLPNVNSTQEVSFDCSAWPIRWESLENLNWQSRYITFTKGEIGAHLGEVYICGTPTDGTQATCQDGILNQNETEVDCGGICPACETIATCQDGIQNQNETGIDCGGVCPSCETEGSDCEENINGYSFYGTFENHNYYLSNDILTWSQAEALCVQNGGHLVTINSAEENEFVRSNLESNFILIGLNDRTTEGNLNWISGQTLSYNNVISNTADNDYGMMNFWDGSWTFVGENVRKAHLMEIPCSTNPGSGISLNCPGNLEILLPFQQTSGQVIYDVSATTDCPSGDVSISISGIPSGGTGIFGRYPIEVTATDPCGNEETCSFYVDLKTRVHESSATCPEDITVVAADINGAVVTWDEPIPTTDCEALTLTYQGFYSSGDLIPIGTHQIDYVWREEGAEAICGSNASCNFEVSVLAPDQGGDCPEDIDGFTVLGEYNDSKYYISNTKKNWQEAELYVKVNTDGYLISISSEEENEFIRSKIGNEIVIIGLADRQNEGDLVWDSGEPYIFSKLEVENTFAVDNGYMNFWNGGWGLDGPWTSRYFILEVPCLGQEDSDISLTCPADIDITLNVDEESRLIDYPVILSTDCEQGGLTYEVFGGPDSGGAFTAGSYFMSIEATDNCGNVEICSFIISVLATEDGPKPDMTLSNFFYNETAVSSGDILSFKVDISNIGTAVSGSFNLKSYISTDRNLSLDDIQDGIINTSFFAAGQTVSGVGGALTVPANLSDGNYYVILVVDANDELNELNEGNNVLVASSTFEVGSGGTDCSDIYSNATYLGEFGNSKYFMSNVKYNWQEGQTYMQDNLGNLVSINSAAENQFIYQRLNSEIVFIGLNDEQVEGSFVWDSGAGYNYNNFTTTNSASGDYAYMNFWDGTWGLDGRWTKRKLLIEVECSNTATAFFDHNNEFAISKSTYNSERLKITKLFPNPATDLIHIEIQSLETEKIQMEVYNMDGQLIMEESIDVIDGIQMIPIEIGTLNSGVYQILIQDDQGHSHTQRFIKSRG